MDKPLDQVRLYLFYDPECPLCCRFRQLVGQWDRQGAIRALALDAPEVKTRFPDFDVERAKRELTVCSPAGDCLQGELALGRLAQLLPGIRRLQWVYQLPGMTPVVRGLYRTVHRYRRQLCRRCGEKWMPSRKYSQRKRRGS